MKRYTRLFLQLFSPVSKNKEKARRERILFILLSVCILLSFFATAKLWLVYVSGVYGLEVDRSFSSIIFPILILFFSGCFYIAKKGHSLIISYILIFFIFCTALYTSYFWGADLPQALLTYCLLIVMSGILINSRFSFIVSGAVLICLQIIVRHQLQNPTLFYEIGKQEEITPTDITMYGVTFFAIAIISWLFNRESEQALERARASEQSLLKERDNLEKTVQQRTEELRQSQNEKINQLYRFADLGSRVASILHDLSTPVSIVALNLEEMKNKSKQSEHKEVQQMKSMLKHAMFSIHKIEEFIGETRMSLQNLEVKRTFTVSKEIKLILKILQKKLVKENIVVTVDVKAKNISLFGNAIKFHQLITNLITNAADAYQNHPRTVGDQSIMITVEQTKSVVIITVTDKAGGMDESVKHAMFQQFFSTKHDSQHLGIGLSICKEVVEHDFGGTINCTSTLSEGTTFVITLPKN